MEEHGVDGHEKLTPDFVYKSGALTEEEAREM
jgi:hypothetical protein